MSWSITTNATTGNVTGSSVERVKANETVTISAGDNIAITQNGHTISVALMRDINLNSVTANVINTKDLTATGNVTLGGGVNTTVKIAENTTVDMGRNRITNIGNATAAHDAVTLEQMNAALRNAGSAPGLVNRVDQLARDLHKVDKNARAGIAGAVATAGIPQVYLPGKSGFGVGVGNRDGQTALAVGYSKVCDNAKHVIKLSTGVDTQSKATFGADYMYQW